MHPQDHTIARAPTLTQSVAERINDAILDGSFEPGERLVETRLSTMFGVSRAPVREALKILETSGLVRIVVGRGTFVVRLDRDELMRVVVAHALLMGLAGRLACVHGTARSVTAMARAQRMVERAAESGRFEDVRRQMDALLCAVFDAGEDTVLRQTVQGMRGQILVHRSHLVGDGPLMDRMAATTASWLAAIGAGDPDAVEAIVRSSTLLCGFAVIGQEPPPSVACYLSAPAIEPARAAALTAAAGI